jgi:hypothetical protein
MLTLFLVRPPVRRRAHLGRQLPSALDSTRPVLPRLVRSCLLGQLGGVQTDLLAGWPAFAGWVHKAVELVIDPGKPQSQRQPSARQPKRAHLPPTVHRAELVIVPTAN